MFWRSRFLMVTWALSLFAIMAMSIRILFASHVRCGTVGSLPPAYLLFHLATCASASFSGNLASVSDRLPWNPTTLPSKSSGLVALQVVNPRSKGPKTPTGACDCSLSFKRSRVRYS